jgi:hypothetical protein
VGPAVGQPGYQVGVSEHRADGVERPVDPVVERQVEQTVTGVGEEQIEREPSRLHAFPFGARLDAVDRRRLVVRRVSELEDAVEPRRGALRDQCRPHVGVGKGRRHR